MKLGIDFGTSFSLAAVQYLGHIQSLLPPGVYGIPSLFYHDPDYGPVTGAEAEDAAGLSKDLVREIKLDLRSSRTVNGHTYTARQIVGYILREVKQTALTEAEHQMIDEPLDGVVISIPAKFEHNEREALLEAARIPEAEGGPGLKVLGLIKEPVAAALYYFDQPLADQTRILVYDLGGGTCDAAIVEADSSWEEKYNVIDADMRRIGGKDWDSRLENYIAQELQRKGFLLSGDDYAAIKVTAMKTKHGFSRKRGADYVDKVTTRIAIGGRNERFVITRAMFYEMTNDLLDETIRMTKSLVARNSRYPVKELICVGGSCNMPQVTEAMKRAFPNLNVRVLEPEMAIARGAAIYANLKPKDSLNKALSDIASYSYGIRSYRDYDFDPDDLAIFNLIKQNARLPVTGEHVFCPSVDNQQCVSFKVYESSIKDDDYDYVAGVHSHIMEVQLQLPPNTSKNTNLYTKMTLTTDGILEVVADDHKGHIIKGRKKLEL